MMKLKLRKLREKREKAAHFKGVFPISIETVVFKRQRDGVALKKCHVFAKYSHLDKLKRYLILKFIPKAKKRGGKNR